MVITAWPRPRLHLSQAAISALPCPAPAGIGHHIELGQEAVAAFRFGDEQLTMSS